MCDDRRKGKQLWVVVVTDAQDTFMWVDGIYRRYVSAIDAQRAIEGDLDLQGESLTHMYAHCGLMELHCPYQPTMWEDDVEYRTVWAVVVCSVDDTFIEVDSLHGDEMCALDRQCELEDHDVVYVCQCRISARNYLPDTYRCVRNTP